METRATTLVIVLLIMAQVNAAGSERFGEGADSFEIEFVTVGSPGNADDERFTLFDSNPLSIGGVDYEFEIAKFEITCEELNKVARQAAFVPGRDDYCRFRTGTQSPGGLEIDKARRFLNWLNTSSGYPAAYEDPLSDDITRNPLARYFLPNADEFHKAAFYDPASATYLDHSTGSNLLPITVEGGTEPNTLVAARILPPGTYADVTAAGGLSAFGTMAQVGNRSEWEEDSRWYSTGVRDAGGLSYLDSRRPERKTGGRSFRVVALTVPEPTSLALICMALSPFALCQRQRRLSLTSWTTSLT